MRASGYERRAAQLGRLANAESCRLGGLGVVADGGASLRVRTTALLGPYARLPRHLSTLYAIEPISNLPYVHSPELSTQFASPRAPIRMPSTSR